MRSRPAKSSRSSRGRSSTPTSRTRRHPWLVFLQGGPGFPGPRPSTRSGWLKRALQEYRVLLLDSRGNGQSSGCAAADARAARRRPGPGAITSRTFAPTASSTTASSSAGSSRDRTRRGACSAKATAGFCAVHYLSAHPEGLREVFITGGLPPLAASADDYYRATYPVVRSKTQKHFRPLSRRRSPGAAHHGAPACARRHAAHRRPADGAPLSASSGFQLGFDEGMETLHYLLESAFCEGSERRGAEPAVPARRGEFAALRDQSDLRGAARDVLHAAGRVALVRAAHSRRVSRNELGAGTAAVVHRRNDLSVDVRRVSSRSFRCARSRSYWRSDRTGRCSTIRRGSRRTRFLRRPRSTPTTCTCRASTRAHRRGDRRHEGLDHQRVRAQRTAHRRRARVRAPRRSRPEPRLAENPSLCGMRASRSCRGRLGQDGGCGSGSTSRVIGHFELSATPAGR